MVDKFEYGKTYKLVDEEGFYAKIYAKRGRNRCLKDKYFPFGLFSIDDVVFHTNKYGDVLSTDGTCICDQDEYEFFEEVLPQQEATTPTKSQPLTKEIFTKVELSPKEIFQAMLNGEEFYWFKKDKMWFDGEQFLMEVDDTTDSVSTIQDGDQSDIYTKEIVELNWVDAAKEFIVNSRTDLTNKVPFMEILTSEYLYLEREELLELSRVILRATGELPQINEGE